MTDKKPYEPPTYGVRSLAIERRIAGKPPRSVDEQDDGAETTASDEADTGKAEKGTPVNKALKASPANKGKK